MRRGGHLVAGGDAVLDPIDEAAQSVRRQLDVCTVFVSLFDTERPRLPAYPAAAGSVVVRDCAPAGAALAGDTCK